MEIGTMVLYGAGFITLFAGSLIGGFMARLVVDWFGFQNLERRIYSLENAIKGRQGAAGREEKANRMSAAIAEAAAMLQAGKKPEEILKEIAPRYPDVALELVKKGMAGKLSL